MSKGINIHVSGGAINAGNIVAGDRNVVSAGAVSLGAGELAELERLVVELKNALAPVSPKGPGPVAATVAAAEATARAARPAADGGGLAAAAKGLKEAAEVVKDIAPAAIGVVHSILKLCGL